MAFIGVIVLEQINDRVCRVSGAQLLASAIGTIGLASATGAPPDIVLPSDLGAMAYDYQGSPVPLTSSIRIWDVPTTSGPLTNLPVSIVKTGITVGTWRATVTNTNAGSTTQELEFWIEFLGGGRVAQPARVGP